MTESVVLSDFYVNDVLTGANSIPEAIELRQQLQELMQSNGFPLRKWTSNERSVLDTIPSDFIAPDGDLKIEETGSVKTLGLYWSPKSDEFGCKTTTFSDVISKRTVLSDIARIFDPLGLVAPVILTAKKFMQTLWNEGLECDAPFSEQLQNSWIHIRQNLLQIDAIKVPRRLIPAPNYRQITLVGFADASEKAYGMCIYLVVQYSDSEFSSRLIISKSKVALLKTQSVPRLELCGALMLAEQLQNVQAALKLPIASVKAFSDSKIVLSWLAKEAYCWKVFVANRVAKIRDLLSPDCWGHVCTEENPADLVSRGCDTELLMDKCLW